MNRRILMKVILLKDVKKQGKKGDVIEVSDGYGRNFLIKNGLARLADTAAMNQLKSKEQADERIAQEELAEAKQIKAELDKEESIVKISAKIGEDGRLFGTIPSKQIAGELQKQHSIKVDRRKIQLDENLSAIGQYKVPIKLHSEVTANIKVQVVEE